MSDGPESAGTAVGAPESGGLASGAPESGGRWAAGLRAAAGAGWCLAPAASAVPAGPFRPDHPRRAGAGRRLRVRRVRPERLAPVRRGGRGPRRGGRGGQLAGHPVEAGAGHALHRDRPAAPRLAAAAGGPDPGGGRGPAVPGPRAGAGRAEGPAGRVLACRWPSGLPARAGRAGPAGPAARRAPRARSRHPRTRRGGADQRAGRPPGRLGGRVQRQPGGRAAGGRDRRADRVPGPAGPGGRHRRALAPHAGGGGVAEDRHRLRLHGRPGAGRDPDPPRAARHGGRDHPAAAGAGGADDRAAAVAPAGLVPPGDRRGRLAGPGPGRRLRPDAQDPAAGRPPGHRRAADAAGDGRRAAPPGPPAPAGRAEGAAQLPLPGRGARPRDRGRCHRPGPPGHHLAAAGKGAERPDGHRPGAAPPVAGHRLPGRGGPPGQRRVPRP